MSVAKCLGVDDLDAPNMQKVRAEWPRWQDVEPALNVVADVAALPPWMTQSTPAGRTPYSRPLAAWLGATGVRTSHLPGYWCLARRWSRVGCAGLLG